MHTVRLQIEDSVFDKVIYFLKNLPQNEVKIITEDVHSSIKTKPNKLNSISIETKDFKFNREEANAR